MKTTFVCLFRAVYIYIYISDQKTKTIMNTSYFLQSREKSKALLFDSCKIFPYRQQLCSQLRSPQGLSWVVTVARSPYTSSTKAYSHALGSGTLRILHDILAPSTAELWVGPSPSRPWKASSARPWKASSALQSWRWASSASGLLPWS